MGMVDVKRWKGKEEKGEGKKEGVRVREIAETHEREKSWV